MIDRTDNSDAMKYVKSLKDVVKRRYAANYLTWMRAGRKGESPSKGALSPVLAKAVSQNLDSLS